MDEFSEIPQMASSYCLFVLTSLWSNVWRVSSLKSHSFFPNSKWSLTHSLTRGRYRYRAASAAKKSIDQILNLLALLCESGDERPLSYGALCPIIWTIGPPSVICDIVPLNHFSSLSSLLVSAMISYSSNYLIGWTADELHRVLDQTAGELGKYQKWFPVDFLPKKQLKTSLNKIR